MELQVHGVPVYLLVAIILSIADMATHVYDVHTRNVGIVRDSPWYRRSSLLADVRDRARSFFRSWRLLLADERGFAATDLLTAGLAKRRKQDPPEVVHEGTSIKLPADPRMSLREAVAWLTKIEAAEEQVVRMSEMIDAYPWDGARALTIAIQQRFGFAELKTQQGFFGSNPPELRSIETDFGVTESIVWGMFALPGIEGQFWCSSTRNNAGQLVFNLGGDVKKKHSAIVRELAQLTRELLKSQSIYRGKAVRFTVDDEGEINVPQFIDLSRVNPHELVFSTEIREQIETTVFAPIDRRDWCKALGIPFKRGICLLGEYGVGKTLAVYVAAMKAKSAGITFILVEDAEQLPRAMEFARQYSPAVVAVEDIDRVTRERDDLCNEIMDSLDGIEAKDSDVMTLFTSNHHDHIHAAMRRPGRIDTFIKVAAPDALAVEKLLRLYGRGLIAIDENLRPVCEMLAGKIPAVIREVVERAKLAAVARAESLADARELTASDLTVASRRLMMQLGLFEVAPPVDTLRSAMVEVGRTMFPIGDSLETLATTLSKNGKPNGHAVAR